MKNFLKKLWDKINFKYVLFLTIFTLAILEIGCRIYMSRVLQKSANPKFCFDSYRIYKHVPNFHEGDGKRDWIVIDAQGFRRTTDVSLRKPAHTFRVFLLGGSAAHGISSAAPYPIKHLYPDETIDAYLEKELKAKHPGYNIEVINAAVTGYQVFQHTSYLLSELLDYDPDLVIFFDGANDHFVNNTDYNYYGDNIYQFWKPRLVNPSIAGSFNYFMLWLSKYSCMARLYMSWEMNSDASHAATQKYDLVSSKKFSNKEAFIEAHKQVARKQFLRSIETNISILKNNHIECIICLQPMQIFRDSTLYSPAEQSFAHLKDFSDYKILYPTVLEELKELTRRYNVSFVDVNNTFNDPKYKSQQLFIDYCHLNAMGSEVSANALLPIADSLFTQREAQNEVLSVHP